MTYRFVFSMLRSTNWAIWDPWDPLPQEQQEQQQDPHDWLLKMLRRVASKNLPVSGAERDQFLSLWWAGTSTSPSRMLLELFPTARNCTEKFNKVSHLKSLRLVKSFAPPEIDSALEANISWKFAPSLEGAGVFRHGDLLFSTVFLWFFKVIFHFCSILSWFALSYNLRSDWNWYSCCIQAIAGEQWFWDTLFALL